MHHKPDLKARMRQAWQAFLLGGPIGVSYAVQDAFILWRMRRAVQCIDSEKNVHRRELAKLRAHINHLAGQQACLHAAAAQYRRYCDKKALAAEVKE